VEYTLLVIACAFGITFLLALGFLLVLRYQYDPASQALVAEIKRTQSPIQCFYAVARFEANQINGGQTTWKYFIVVVEPDTITIHPRKTKAEPFTFTPDQIRWFGRPHKYEAGLNDLWIHLEIGDGWHLLKFRLYQGLMQDLVRGLKAVASDELITAYRRRRPYIHAGPVDGQPASQDIHGAWTLDEPVTLYLMPRLLIILRGTGVMRKIPLEAVQEIGAFRRLDEPDANGLVRFRAEEETFAFAIVSYEDFAVSLADAAKRTLEAPIMQKQKKKYDDYGDEPEDFEDGDW
jgi:hypothetical protein